MAFVRNLLVLGLLQAAAANAAASAGAPIVDLGYAKYQGVSNQTTGLTTFFGIRYAAAPTGDLRFRAPQTPAPTSGILDASVPGPECMQGQTGTALTQPFPNPTSKRGHEKRAIVQGEDCLLLNVYSPPAAAKKKLPVIVWIHGGGYVGGNADSTGEDLVHNANDEIVAVLIQYRLGVFGFLPGSEVKKNGDLNAGILDQQFALQWVQKHISLFGGDPNQVTIWGESAGAGSVLQHLIAHGGNTQPPLFKRAITSSTFLPFQYRFDDRIPEQLFATTAQQTGCANATDVLACLRALDVATLETANFNICGQEFFGEFQYVPVVDGSLILDSPVATITRGRLNGELLLSVTNTLEGSVFVSSKTTNGTLEDYITNAVPTLESADVERAAQIYSSVTGLNTVNDQAIAVQGELIFICPTYFLLGAFGSRGHKGEFAIPPGSHGEDVQFYFNSAGTVFPNEVFIQSFAGAFADFTVSGNLNAHVSSENQTPNWPSWANGRTEMLFNTTADFTTPVIHTIQTDDALLQRCEFWRSLAPKSGQ